LKGQQAVGIEAELPFSRAPRQSQSCSELHPATWPQRLLQEVEIFAGHLYVHLHRALSGRLHTSLHRCLALPTQRLRIDGTVGLSLPLLL
jgi:hypothetical protein